MFNKKPNKNKTRDPLVTSRKPAKKHPWHNYARIAEAKKSANTPNCLSNTEWSEKNYRHVKKAV